MFKLNGAGVSLRSKHFPVFLAEDKIVDWIEILADQYLNSYGVLRQRLQQICAKYPVSMHCVSLSIAGTDPLDLNYLQHLKQLIALTNPLCVSDHLCWSSHRGKYSHDLLPLVYNKKTLDHVSSRVNQVQDILQRPFIFENLSHYITDINKNYLHEAQFINELCARTGCGILLDINNVYVSAHNLKSNAEDYLEIINPAYVQQIHLAGHAVTENRLIDTHGDIVCDKVWQLYKNFIAKAGAVPSCIEWDTDIPSWDVMQQQAQQIQRCLHKSVAKTQQQNQQKSCELPGDGVDLAKYQDDFWQKINSSAQQLVSSGYFVHHNSMLMQRKSALEQVYPCCMKILGNDLFDELALAYLSVQPSLSADITAGYDSFAEFIAKQDRLEDYISALAAYEWQWYGVFHGFNCGEIDLHYLQQQIAKHQTQIKLICTPGLVLHKSTYPVLALWESCQAEYSGEKPAIKNGEYYYAMHQRHGFVVTVELSEIMYLSLGQLQYEKTLSAWCDNYTKQDDFSADFAAYFFKQGLITLTTKQEV